ncbi:MAG TPA: phosphatidate cytidylyltransferase [Syntrophomonadaceae bacterium]|nr:phosphatidate cytidylyltransferase [Syntrophomonadaceae bacterium]HQA06892.1 phosphatidate cytidylyltransferase [Syntrophomonadaceae bacterium]HQE22724.1 phosphatidate cytidylyltransferase [Syntrophomonadaceae bacterium]
MLRTRVITAVIGIPLLLGILYAGELFRLGFFLVLALVGLYEFTAMMRTAGKTGPVLPALLFMMALLLGDLTNQPLIPLLFIALLLAVFITVVNYPRISFDNTALIMFFSAYLGICLFYAIQLSFLEQGFMACLLAFLLTWASDIGGYAVGRRWGKHKLAPRLSPNKSWEGALGGIGLAAITALVLSILTDMVTLTHAYALVLGVVASIAAHFGDLFMSGVKRLFQVKDSGWFLPGHGGVLDRFDSFLVVAPVVYYCLQYLG